MSFEPGWVLRIADKTRLPRQSKRSASAASERNYDACVAPASEVGAADCLDDDPRRCFRCSPTRKAFAIIVSAGLTAGLEGKKLPSTTYKLSRSCALQSIFSAELRGSLPKRIVPF